MPHLHLPIDHTDADLVLAANVADVVGSEDLYVTWCHVTGPGAIPEVEAVVRDERPLGLVPSLFAVVVALWSAITRRPAGTAAAPAAPADRTRQGEPSA